MVGAKEIYHEKIILEELKHGIFSERSRNITDTCDRTWSRSWNLGAINLMEGYGNSSFTFQSFLTRSIIKGFKAMV